jgi:hypothetical protein
VQAAAVAKRAGADARDAAKNVATEAEKKEDGRAALEFGSLATGHEQRPREEFGGDRDEAAQGGAIALRGGRHERAEEGDA